MNAGRRVVLTVGHSTHSIGDFVELLKRHEVTAVADVRSAPYSRRCPQFRRQALGRSLRDRGIQYLILGRELGGRSDDPADYGADGRIRFDRLRRKPTFAEGLDRVLRGSEGYRIALLCAERDPLNCHRFLLVAQALAEAAEVGADPPFVGHIILSGPDPRDSRVESHARLLDRLLEATGQQPTLWGPPGATRPERVRRAIAIQTARFGHRSGRTLSRSAGARGTSPPSAEGPGATPRRRDGDGPRRVPS